ncbi:MAG: septicolysin, partial [Coriobacteriia bacterium]|nr:septicolysin [Coriobacteriia bacterium]
HSFIKAAAESVVKPAAYGTREIRWVGTISAADLQKEADELAIRIRDVNLEIQEANWQIDI